MSPLSFLKREIPRRNTGKTSLRFARLDMPPVRHLQVTGFTRCPRSSRSRADYFRPSVQMAEREPSVGEEMLMSRLMNQVVVPGLDVQLGVPDATLAGFDLSVTGSGIINRPRILNCRPDGLC